MPTDVVVVYKQAILNSTVLQYQILYQICTSTYQIPDTRSRRASLALLIDPVSCILYPPSHPPATPARREEADVK